jgi:hypothetical protein
MQNQFPFHDRVVKDDATNLRVFYNFIYFEIQLQLHMVHHVSTDGAQMIESCHVKIPFQHLFYVYSHGTNALTPNNSAAAIPSSVVVFLSALGVFSISLY